MMELKNKRVTVVGLGKSGLAAVRLLKGLGAEVRATDSVKTAEVETNANELAKRAVQLELGSHSESFLDGSDLVVTSPGVSNESLAIKYAESKNIPIISEIELAYSLCRAPVIAVSGTNGKSTVTTLIGEMLKGGGRNAVVCGNIGVPFSEEVLRTDENSVVVLEISSFQLERTNLFKPKLSCLLNVTQDHFDRYADMDQYFNAKKRLFSNQDGSDYAVLNFDAPKIRALGKSIRPNSFYFSKHRLSKEHDGAYVENGHIVIRHKNKFWWIASLEDLGLEGDHNIENYLASILAAFFFDVEPEVMGKTVSNFKGLAHRFEAVDTINGVRYIDDSKATNVDSTIKALNTCRAPVILIAGGRDKESNYKVLAKHVKEKVRDLILFGETKEKIAGAVGNVKPVHFVESLDRAVRLASEKAKRGDVVLLSPACASFDMFRNYEERGEAFKKAIVTLKVQP